SESHLVSATRSRRPARNSASGERPGIAGDPHEPLVVLPEVGEQFAYHAAVDLVVPFDFGAERGLPKGNASLFRLLRRSPGSNHRPESIRWAIRPARLDESLSVEGPAEGLQSKSECSVGDHGLRLDDAVQ